MKDNHFKIMLVEDNPGDVRLIQLMLRDQGDSYFELEHASSLTQGLRRLDHEDFDLILLDLGLPERQGLDTLRAVLIKAPSLPIVVLTGLDDETMGLQALQIGAQDYLIKGQITGSLLVCSIRYAAERKRAEGELKRSQRILADIINFLPDATIVIDRHGRVIAWNQAIQDMTGVKTEDIVGKGDYEYAIPFYGIRRPILVDLALMPQEEVEKSYAQFERRGRILFDEAYMPNMKEGPVYLSASAAVLFDNEGNVYGAIESIRDITDRKRAEELKQKAEKELKEAYDELELKVKERTAELEVRNAEMERFVYTISHELRAPLVSIGGLLGFLKQDAEKGDLDQIMTDYQMANNTLSKMDQLLGETLELSKIGRIANPPGECAIQRDSERSPGSCYREAKVKMHRCLGGGGMANS